MCSPLCNIHTHNITEEDYINVVNLNMYEYVETSNFFSVGVHPMDVENTDITKATSYIKQQLHQNNCIAIGEVGLDCRYKQSFDIQQDVFIQMSNLADEFNTPLIIHCVRAWSDLIALRKELKTDKTWIFHGFNANQLIAEQLTQRGCYLSFGKALLFNNKVQQVFKQIPLKYVFFETDDEDLHISEIYQKASELKVMALSDLTKIIYSNFVNVFGNVWTNIGCQEQSFC